MTNIAMRIAPSHRAMFGTAGVRIDRSLAMTDLEADFFQCLSACSDSKITTSPTNIDGKLRNAIVARHPCSARSEAMSGAEKEAIPYIACRNPIAR